MSTIDTLSVKVGIDADELERGADKATTSVKGIGDGARSTRPRVDNMGDSFDRFGRRADDVDTRAMGFRDTLTGVEDSSRGVSEIMKGNLFDGVLLLGMGIGDLASGVFNFGVQFARTAANFVTNHARMLAVHMANAARMAAGWLIAMGPIALVILAIAAIIAILVALGVDFDTVKNAIGAAWEFIRGAAEGVFNWLTENWPLVLAILTGPIGLAVLAIITHWETIKSAVGAALGWIGGRATAAKDWIVARFNDVVGFVTGLPGRIAAAATGLFDGFKSAFKSAINAIIGWWNGLSFTLPTIDIPRVSLGPLGSIGGGSFGGSTFSTPNIPFLARGGIVRRRHGGILANLGEGRHDEAVIPLPRGMRAMGAGGPGVVVHAAGSILAERDVVRIIRDEMDRGGLGGRRR